MKWIIRKELFQQVLCDAKNQKTAYMNIKKGVYFITDDAKQILFTISPKTLLTLEISGKNNSTAEIRLADDETPIHPARAEELSFSIDNTEYTIHQSIRREFSVFRNGTKIGSIKNIMLNPVRITINTSISSELIALIYALSHRMYHQDDIEII